MAVGGVILTFLNMIDVTFYNQYDQLIARRTYIHSFFTADTNTIEEAAYNWAKEQQRDLNAQYFIIGNGFSEILSTIENG